MSDTEQTTATVIDDAGAILVPQTHHLPAIARNAGPMKKRRNAGKRRNAARPRSRPRNAGPFRFGGGTKPPKEAKEAKPSPPDEVLPWKDVVVPVMHATGSAFATSFGAVQLAKTGLVAPSTLAWIMGLGGTVLSVAARKQRHSLIRAWGRGIASAGASQIVLQWLAPTPPPPVAVAPTPPKRNLAIGELPPHALEDAFHRAQAELAITADPYATSRHIE